MVTIDCLGHNKSNWEVSLFFPKYRSERTPPPHTPHFAMTWVRSHTQRFFKGQSTSHLEEVVDSRGGFAPYSQQGAEGVGSASQVRELTDVLQSVPFLYFEREILQTRDTPCLGVTESTASTCFQNHNVVGFH